MTSTPPARSLVRRSLVRRSLVRRSLVRRSLVHHSLVHRSLVHRSLVHRSLVHHSLVHHSLVHRSLVHRSLVHRSLGWSGLGIAFCVLAWVVDSRAIAPDAPAPWSYLVLAALAVLAAWWPVAGCHRMQRLARRPGPAFVMHATTASSASRGLLHLFPLDAGLRARPVCTVPLLTAVAGSAGGERFPVEVKGTPRPLGRVAVRTSDGLLWTTGRALTT